MLEKEGKRSFLQDAVGKEFDRMIERIYPGKIFDHTSFKDNTVDAVYFIIVELKSGRCTGDVDEDTRILQEIDNQTKKREKPSTKITNTNVEPVASVERSR